MEKKRTLVLGDIHGNYKGLLQCFERSGFDKENDTLIFLGDVADGWSQVYESVEELLSVKNLIAIRGNHDQWFDVYLQTGRHPQYGEQGSQASIDSYNIDMRITNEHHHKFFAYQHNYYVDSDRNKCFVHGGFNRHEEFTGQRQHIYYWDRDLWLSALSFKEIVDKSHKFKMKTPFEEVFIGHTSTSNWGTDQPMKAANIWNLDTGSGFAGRLTIMDIDTHEYWQSDLVKELYKNEKGR